MNQKLSVAQLKSISRGQLLGNYGIAIGADVTANGIIFFVSLLCSTLTAQNQTVAGTMITFLITLILDILNGIFLLGLARFYLNLVCRRPCSVTDVFYGFRYHTNKALITRALIVIMELIVMIPFVVCTAFSGTRESSVLFLFSCITLVIGGILYIYIMLLYSQVYFIMLDFPGYSSRQIMSTSRRIMRGNKGRLFYMVVTLIPYYLLAFLSCGIALLWINPYLETTLTNFYLDLMHREYAV